MDEHERLLSQLRILEQQKVSIQHFLVQLHNVIEEMNLMYEAIEEYLMVMRTEIPEKEAMEVRDNIVPLFHRRNTDEPEESV